MEVIDAFWEKRNFGYDVIEITINNDDLDNVDYLIKEIDGICLKCNYVVVKFPVGNLQLLHTLQDIGFYFMETQFELGMNVKDYSVPALFARYIDSVYYEEIDKDVNKWIKVINKIEAGMFSTDRVYLDPALNKDVALKRYRNWMMDYINNPNASLYTLNGKKGKEIMGTGIYTIEGQVMHGIIGGMFSRYQNFGIGVAITHFLMQTASKKEIKVYLTKISSNNMVNLRLHSAFGFLLKNEQYVMRKVKQSRS
jgi:hypothetical protein